MSHLYAKVAQDTVAAGSEGDWVALKANKMGFPIVIDFYTQMAIEGRIFQVRAGTITTPVTGDIAITDTAAEFCVDAVTGYTVIPVYQCIALDEMTDAVVEMGTKSVAGASSSGTAFLPLPLLRGGSGSHATARAQGAGSVTVTAELATTTRRHWSFASPLECGAGAEMTTFEWSPRCPPIIAAGYCLYTQIADGTGGPDYFANLDFVELPTTGVS